MKSLLYEGDMKLDGQFDSRAFPYDESSPPVGQSRVALEPPQQGGTKSKKEDGHDSPDESVISSEGTEHHKLDRLQQRSREIRSKLRALGQYGTPSAIRSLRSSATVGARKPFRVPLKQHQNCDATGDKNA